jgi:phenylalanyl-tRNA synthetase beta chain
MGGRGAENWADSQDKVDFYDIKGDVEALLATAAGLSFEFQRGEHSALHPGQTAKIVLENQELGWVGAIHPELQRKLDLPQTCYLFELLLAPFNDRCLPRFTELSKFPEVRRDLAIIIDQEVAAAEVMQLIRQIAGENLRNLLLFDVYAGKGIDLNKKSLAFGLTLQHQERTLDDEEVNTVIEAVVAALEQQFGAILRK